MGVKVDFPGIPASVQKPLMIGAAVGLGLFALYAVNRGVKGVTSDIAGGIVSGAFDATAGLLQGSYNALPETLQPHSENNIIYSTISKAGASVSGDKNWTLGGWLYDITH